jgi:hypothetical protein
MDLLTAARFEAIGNSLSTIRDAEERSDTRGDRTENSKLLAEKVRHARMSALN